MPISREELAAPIREPQLIPMDSDDATVFGGFIVRWPSGGQNIWWVAAPSVPVTEGWMRTVHAELLQRMIEDLQGRSRGAGVAPNRGAWRDFQRYDRSITAALRGILDYHANKRLDKFRKMATMQEAVKSAYPV